MTSSKQNKVILLKFIKHLLLEALHEFILFKRQKLEFGEKRYFEFLRFIFLL